MFADLGHFSKKSIKVCNARVSTNLYANINTSSEFIFKLLENEQSFI